MEPADTMAELTRPSTPRVEEEAAKLAEQLANERAAAEALAAIEDARGQAMAASREADADGNTQLGDEARNAVELCRKAEQEIKANRGQRRSGGKEYGQIVKDIRGVVSGVTEHVAEDGPEDNPKNSTLRTVHAQQAEAKQAAKKSFMGIPLPSKPQDANHIVVTARRTAKNTQAAARDDEDEYVGTGKNRRHRKTEHAISKGAVSAITTATFGFISEETADEVISTTTTAISTTATGVGAMLTGDMDAADKAARTMARGTSAQLQDFGLDKENAEWVGRGVHNVLWAGGRVGSTPVYAAKETVKAAGKLAGDAYEAASAAASGALAYVTGSEAKAATPPMKLNKFELELAQAAGLDKNRDGKFDAQEMQVAKALARKLNGMGITMQSADKDHNGDISAQELGTAIRAAKAKAAQKQH